ncbi:hypothetical protein [Ornithinimicrobium sediminis]|uniref:hypothetical protein n=1 Tax=Ornithinimicrobium sediminis TaxID=2904603 RepID=UPI001E5DAF5B|nr:hypothetical protein [Ornithinimicrobium sediminis]MCE0487533.1 hypothetical protein [Ornithinimicrobium sediminis]
MDQRQRRAQWFPGRHLTWIANAVLGVTWGVVSVGVALTTGTWLWGLLGLVVAGLFLVVFVVTGRQRYIAGPEGLVLLSTLPGRPRRVPWSRVAWIEPGTPGRSAPRLVVALTDGELLELVAFRGAEQDLRRWHEQADAGP